MSNPIIWVGPKTGVSHYAAIRWLLGEGDAGYAEGYRVVIETLDGERYPFKTNGRAGK